ncbi:hypothetical protein N7507_007608 [Penicillium longicatenatum]|nr:hypothetical protein N7507_007608 [Penicillium longicatenatum]
MASRSFKKLSIAVSGTIPGYKQENCPCRSTGYLGFSVRVTNEALEGIADVLQDPRTDTMRKTLPPPSLMVRKFMNHNASGQESNQNRTPSSNPSQEGSTSADPFERQYCFFYGTLMNPETLSRVLRTSDSLLIMSRARVIGYDVKLWGPYPALIDGEPL